MKFLILIFATLFTFSANAQTTCEVKQVDTPIIFQKPPVDVSNGTLSIQLPNCKVLSLGFPTRAVQELLYQVTNGGGEDETFGKVKRYYYSWHNQDYRDTYLYDFFVVPDGIMLYGWFLHSGLPVDMLFFKFRLDGTLDLDFNAFGSTSFSTNGPGARTYINQFTVSSVKVLGDVLELGLTCDPYAHRCKDHRPVSTTIQMGWRLPALLKENKAIPAKCTNFTGEYKDTFKSIVKVTQDGCRSMTIDYDGNSQGIRHELRFKETQVWNFDGEWKYSKLMGWVRFYFENGGLVYERFNDRFLLTKGPIEFRPKKEEFACGYSVNTANTHVLWREPKSPYSCMEIWTKVVKAKE